MSMPATSSGKPYYPPRRSNGCLWGCLILILIFALPPALLGGYGAWFFYDGFRHSTVLTVVNELVREDGIARQVLGEDAVVTEVDGNFFSWMPGKTSHAYEVTLDSPKGGGHLAVTSHIGLSGMKLESAILTGPDGRRYDLLKHQQMPNDGVTRPDTSI